MAEVIHHALEDLHVTVRGGKVQRERRYAIRCGALDGEAHTSEKHVTCPECLEAIRRERQAARPAPRFDGRYK